MSVSPGFKAAINNYLQAAASNDSLFAETLKKVNKNIDECCTYIVNEVQRLHKSKAVAMADDEVFKMAVHYYDEDAIKVGASVRASANHSSDKPSEPKPRVITQRVNSKTTIDNQVSMF